MIYSVHCNKLYAASRFSPKEEIFSELQEYSCVELRKISVLPNFEIQSPIQFLRFRLNFLHMSSISIEVLHHSFINFVEGPQPLPMGDMVKAVKA